jgi:non-ribosomal peptide synthetase component F
MEMASPPPTDSAMPCSLCSTSTRPVTYPTVGQIDEDGVLYNASGFKQLLTSFEAAPGIENCYSAVDFFARKYGERLAVGARPVLVRTFVDGFEKLELGPYEYTPYSEYLKRVERIGSGLSKSVGKGDTVMIYAETRLEWMLSAIACWRCGCTVATCYATLGEEGAQFAINQSKAKLVLCDSKLIKILANSTLAWRTRCVWMALIARAHVALAASLCGSRPFSYRRPGRRDSDR